MRISILIIFFVINCFECFSQSIEDETLTVKQLEKLGMPNPEIKWQNVEYDKCIVILSDLKKENYKSLPQLNSKNSYIYFQRLISPENLQFINDSNIDLQNRAIQLQYITTNFSKLVMLYYQNDNSKQYYSRELTELIIFGLKITDETFILTNYILENTTEVNEDLKLGVQIIKDGYKNTIIGSLYELDRSNKYNIEDLEKLSIALYDNIATNLNWIDPNVRLEIKELIIKIKQKENSPIINDKLLEIMKLI